MDILLHELRRVGWPALVGSPLVAAALLAAGLSEQAIGNRVAVGPVLSLALDVMPLIAGLGAAGIVADRAVELHMSLPTSYPVTVLRRLLLSTTWPALFAAGFALGLWLSGRRVWTPGVPLDQLVWLGPLVALAGLGVVSAAALRSVAAASGLVAVSWLAQELLAPSIARAPWLQPVWLFYRYAPDGQTAWLLNRTVLLTAGVALAVVAFRLLGRSESLIATGGDS